MRALPMAAGLIGAVVLGVILLAIFSTGGDDTPAEAGESFAYERQEGIVTLRDGRFSPESLTVLATTTITFVNRDDRTHRVDFEDAVTKDSGPIAPGRTFSVRIGREGRQAFRSPGVDGMRGAVTVRPLDQQAPGESKGAG